jgi:hypothetical protein
VNATALIHTVAEVRCRVTTGGVEISILVVVTPVQVPSLKVYVTVKIPGVLAARSIAPVAASKINPAVEL